MSLPFDMLDEVWPADAEPQEMVEDIAWQCTVCGHVHEGDQRWEDCQRCGAYGPERRAEITANEGETPEPEAEERDE